MSMPALRFTITPMRCVEEPTPPEAKVSLVFFASSSDAASIQSVLTSFGGHLAHAAGGSYVGVFGHDARRERAKILAVISS